MPTTVPSSAARLSCRCSAVNEPGALLASSTLPLLAPEICHCNPCRQTTGSLGAAYPLLSSAPSAAALEACTLYESSKTHSRYFCSACGTPTFVSVPHRGEAGEWYCMQGIIERDPKQVGEGDPWVNDVVKVRQHKWLDDTGDGGLALKLGTLGGERVQLYGKWMDEPEMTKEQLQDMAREAETDHAAEQELTAKCHCGGVDLRIKKADWFKHDKIDGAEGEGKYLASFCACRSCRLQNGVSLRAFMLVPTKNVTVAGSGKPLAFGSALEAAAAEAKSTLTSHQSSKDVWWSFCSKCGAGFFCWQGWRPEKASLSMGVVRGRGTMAREWVNWRWTVGRRAECIDNELLESVERLS